MATQTLTTMVDDIDGSTDDVVTCAFGLGDSHFEIDLNTAHREELENVLDRFIAAARPVRAAKPARPRRPAETRRTERELNHAVRQWARENGHAVSERGRLAKALIEVYQAAH